MAEIKMERFFEGIQKRAIITNAAIGTERMKFIAGDKKSEKKESVYDKKERSIANKQAIKNPNVM